MNSGAAARYFRFAGLALAVLILIFVIVTANPSEVWRALGDVEGPTAAAVVLLNLPVAALFTLRSHLVLGHMGYRVPLRVLAPVSVLGNVAGALTPAGAGEILRAAALQRNAGLSFAASVTLVAYERVLSTYLLVLSTFGCLALLNLDGAARIGTVALCGALAVLPWFCALFVLPRLPAPDAVGGGGIVSKLVRYGLQLAYEIQGLLKSLPLLAIWSLLTIATFGVIALQFKLVASSLDVPLDFLDAWVAFGGSGVAAIASLLPLGLGVGDGSIAAIIHNTGVPFEEATAVAVLIRAVVTLPLIGLALASYFYLVRITKTPAEKEQMSHGREGPKTPPS